MAGASRGGGSAGGGAGGRERPFGERVREASTRPHHTEEAVQAARRVTEPTFGDVTAGLDPDTARAVSILLAAEVVAATRKPMKMPRRWRDPMVMALIITSAAVLLLAWIVREAQQSRASEIDGLKRQITTLTDTVNKGNARIARLQDENAYLVRLVQRLCALDPKNSACRFTALPSVGSSASPTSSPTSVHGTPQPTASPSSSSPSPSPSSSPDPDPSPTRTLLPSPVPAICPGHRLPCI